MGKDSPVQNISLVDDCPICKNEKNIWKEGKLVACDCVIRSRLIRYLGNFAYEKPLKKTFLIDNSTRSLFLQGHSKRIAAHIKHFLICQGMGFHYRYVPAQEVLDVFLGNNDEYRSLSIFQEPELLIVDLNSVYKNKSLGDLLDQILYMRDMAKLPTWFLSEKPIDDLFAILCSDTFSNRIKSMKCTVLVDEKLTKWKNASVGKKEEVSK